ncbi:efflux RND transporter periplasmic adaptor subunit [Limosilactobacillus pontis]|nr:efflux RND transporter periplasmic adaptor subunit [Limosilactobacillus pontis]
MASKKKRQQSSRAQQSLFKRRRWLIWGSVIIVAMVGIGVVHMMNKDNHQAPKYRTMTVSHQADFALTGKVTPVQTQVLTLPAGKLQNLNVKNGDHVTQGEALLTMYDDESQDNAVELRGDLTKSQQQLQSQQQTINSLRQQLASADGEEQAELQSQLTEARGAYADAQASVNTAQSRLNNADGKINQTVTAPYAGYVTVDQSKQGAPVVTLYSDRLQFSGQVSEYDYGKLHQGTNLHVKALTTNRTETTPVSYLAKIPLKGSGNNSKYEVTANLNADKFMAGQTTKAYINQDGVRIPKTAVRQGKVFVVENGRARAVNVSGRAVNNYYVVTDGIDEGDRIITNPNRQLKNNTRVDSND